MDNVDVFYYINLDHRIDRKQQFEDEMMKVGIPESKCVRIPGVYTKELGILGCGLAHKKALETFLASPYLTCMIFEDDFTFSLSREHMDMILSGLSSENIQFDCILLAGYLLDTQPTHVSFLRRVFDAQTTSGYLITRDFAPLLLQNLEESTAFLEKYYRETGEKHHEYCLDIYWKRLQRTSRWYIFQPKFGFQRESYSDNEYKVTNYGV
jgi:GR25 family glycosyltransferase involved in LPS biosynthesis